jgi:transposase-like protein
MSERAAPMYCPYCGEESLRPWGEDPAGDHGQWRCEDCLRVFRLRMVGLTAGGSMTAGAASPL